MHLFRYSSCQFTYALPRTRVRIGRSLDFLYRCRLPSTNISALLSYSQIQFARVCKCPLPKQKSFSAAATYAAVMSVTIISVCKGGMSLKLRCFPNVKFCLAKKEEC